jgi:muskelin
VLAGLTEDTLTEVASGTLKNDAVAEWFYVRFTDSAGVPFSSRYVKVIPLSYVLLVQDVAFG